MNKKILPPVICDICGEPFEKAKSMTNHRRWHQVPRYTDFQQRYALNSKWGDSRRSKSMTTIHKMVKEGTKPIPNTKGLAFEINRDRFKRLNKDPDFIRKKLKGLMRRPSRPEQHLIKIIEKHRLPFRYVGDGSIVIGFKNPDFIESNGRKLLIELHGWHHKHTTIWHSTEEGCKRYFAQYGFPTLVIWTEELENEDRVVERIVEFIQ